jgi:transposase
MAMARQGESIKERQWRRWLQEWRRSGLSVRRFCALHGLSEPSFYGWRRTIAERHQQTEARPLSGTGHRPDAAWDGIRGDGLPAFVPVTVSAPAPSLEVVLRDGRIVRVPPGFDGATLHQLLALLAEAPPC